MGVSRQQVAPSAQVQALPMEVAQVANIATEITSTATVMFAITLVVRSPPPPRPPGPSYATLAPAPCCSKAAWHWFVLYELELLKYTSSCTLTHAVLGMREHSDDTHIPDGCASSCFAGSRTRIRAAAV